MPVYNPIEGAMIKYQSVNSSTPTPIASTVIANPKTAFAIDPPMVIPESTAVIGGVAKIQGAGVFTTGALALNLSVYIDMQSTAVATATVTPALNLVNTGWEIDIVATILGTGQVEVQGQAIFGGTVVKIKNTVAYSMSTAGGVPVVISAAWGTLALGGSITLRQSLIQVT